MSRSTLKVLLPILVLLAGAGATAALISSRKTPQPVERPVRGPLVEVRAVELRDVRIEIVGQGEVSPRVSVELAPQVTGRVVEVHPSLAAGGRFRSGTTLFVVDPRDYELAVERARSAVASAETVLLRERAEGDAAREEWREVHGAAEPPVLLVREPQIREAEARLAAARADLAAAELNLERTRVSLPFDGLVASESVDVGQLVAAGQRVATVFGTDAVEIRLPLDDRELAWFDVPGLSAVSGSAARARVSADFAGDRYSWPGRVERLEGQVDPRSRMVRVVVTVDRPFSSSERPPLLPGTFVEVAIDGRELDDVVVIPRSALREGGQVWVVEDERRLAIRDVAVVRSDREHAYVASGLEAGEKLVTSALEAVTDGMTVRIAGGASDV